MYAAFEEDSWHRVKVLSILPETNQAQVLFVDFGDTMTLDFHNMRQLEPEFLCLASQSIRCTLSGFGHFECNEYDVCLINTLLHYLFCKNLIQFSDRNIVYIPVVFNRPCCTNGIC